MRLLFLSRIHNKKGIETIFEALLQTSNDWFLDIAGDGEEDYVEFLKAEVKRLNLEEKVNWLGWVNGQAKQQLLAHADIFILPSKNENFANAALEALAQGTPVLISKHVGLGKYVVENNFGWVVDNQVEAFTKILDHIEQVNDIINRTQTLAPRKVRQDFNNEKLTRQYLFYYQQFITS